MKLCEFLTEGNVKLETGDKAVVANLTKLGNEALRLKKALVYSSIQNKDSNVKLTKKLDGAYQQARDKYLTAMKSAVLEKTATPFDVSVAIRSHMHPYAKREDFVMVNGEYVNLPIQFTKK